MSTLERLQAHLAIQVKDLGAGYTWKELAPHVACKDGSTMSVQASETHYCAPRDNHGPYTHVEVWCCGTVAAWEDYGTGEDPYAQVPIEMVAAEIDRRGGFAEEKQQ